MGMVKFSRLRGNNLIEYQDKGAVEQVLGCLINNPQLLKTYTIVETDFAELYQQIIFATIKYFATAEAMCIESDMINQFLETNYPSKYNIFKKHNGVKYVEVVRALAVEEDFYANYMTLRKWSILRELVASGVDVSDYYNPDEVDDKVVEEKSDIFQEATPTTIMAHYKGKLMAISEKYENHVDRVEIKAGGAEARMQKDTWKKAPNFGLSYSSQFLTTAVCGLRRTKFNIISGATGTGKTRVAISNMCRSFVPKFYDSKQKKWIDNPHGMENSVLYIGTELDGREEVEPMIWAYMADVPEDHIMHNTYVGDEEERVNQAIEYLRTYTADNQEKKCGIYLVDMANVTVDQLEGLIEKYVGLYNVSAVFFDYIHLTTALRAEYMSAVSGKMASREDQVLANLSLKLKELAKKFNISIDTGTQLSGEYGPLENLNETVIRGAKSICDKCDAGIILHKPNERDLKKVEHITHSPDMLGKPEPNLVMVIYKNRGARYNNIYIWLYMDYSTLRMHDLFVTDRSYQSVPVEKTRVIVDKSGHTRTFTKGDANLAFKTGELTQEELNMVTAMEKEDPSFRSHITREELKRLKAAEEATAIDVFKEDNQKNLTISDDFDADDYDY